MTASENQNPQHEPEIMTIEEVAKYLRVSERTVYDWVQKGEVPGGKIGTSWRFRRSDIDAWVNSKLSAQTVAAPGDITLERALSPRRVKIIESATKQEILALLAAAIAAEPAVKDKEGLCQAVYQREELMSTGIGLGVAVPHVRLPSVTELLMAAALCRTDVEGYDSLDGLPVRLVFMIAAGQHQHTEQIRLLSTFSRHLKVEAFRTRLLESTDEVALYSELIRGSGVA